MAITQKILSETISELLVTHAPLVHIAVRQRAKFEGWLKFELVLDLSKTFSDAQVEFPCKGKHIDLLAGDSLIELKTINTNYRMEGVETKIRPITKNIKGITDDIDKLRDLKSDKPAYIAFVMFPIDNCQYIKHINKIEAHLGDNILDVYHQTVNIQGTNVLIFSARVN